MSHVTSRTWMPDDLRRLKEMAEGGISAARAAVALRRTIVSVKAKANRLGSPFPDERDLTRERRLREQEIISGRKRREMMKQSDTLRENAENCLQMAERALAEPTAKRYRRMAEAWRTLADEQDWLDGETVCTTPPGLSPDNRP